MFEPRSGAQVVITLTEAVIPAAPRRLPRVVCGCPTLSGTPSTKKSVLPEVCP